MSSFLGIVSTLKANNSIQIINFSNRFSMTDMSLTLSFNPPVVDNGISPPAVRSFECSSQPCSPDVALAGLQLATPTAPAVTSIPASDDNLGDILGSDSDIFSFEVVFVTLGVAGGLFTISCLATFIIFRGREYGNGNMLPVSEKSSLCTNYNQCETAELPCEEHGHSFELAAGSITSKASRKSNQTDELADHSDQGEIAAP